MFKKKPLCPESWDIMTVYVNFIRSLQYRRESFANVPLQWSGYPYRLKDSVREERSSWLADLRDSHRETRWADDLESRWAEWADQLESWWAEWACELSDPVCYEIRVILLNQWVVLLTDHYWWLHMYITLLLYVIT